ncbi:MAG: (d)CMP kinase [Saprospiraceae bacterium]|nr:(d)CMP kinase [Saprospiraceae bacterium]
MKKIVIAIDGFSSCGKSTLARELADSLQYIYIDSGAMYRAVTLYLIRHGISLTDDAQVSEALNKITISFRRKNAECHTILNGEDVETEIRQMEVTEMVSQTATLPAVRKTLVAQQQTMGSSKGIVMDGRDIGTVVFPGAELKIFMNADMEVRVERRYRELLEKGREATPEQVRANLYMRDYIDSTRSDSPLKRAPDAVRLDTTNLTREEQVVLALALARKRMENHTSKDR